jgi:hypothetical protein
MEVGKVIEMLEWYTSYTGDRKIIFDKNPMTLNLNKIHQLWIEETRDEKINEILNGKD